MDSDRPAPEGGSLLDPAPEEMRRIGHGLVDRVVRHLSRMEEDPVWRMWGRPEAEAALREPVPEAGRSLEELLDTLERTVLTHAGRIGHPRFLAFIPSAITFPGWAGEILADAYNLFAGTWVGGSGATMLELLVVDWIREMLGLPEGTGGLLTSGGSEAAMLATVTARHARLNDRTGGAVIYASDQTHSSAARAAWIAGFPREAFRVLRSDPGHRMDPDALRQAVREDRARGLRPFLVVGNAGSTNTGAVDPLRELGRVCREEDLWFHVDAAYGGFAGITARGRTLLEGLEEADSWVLDPHKWLYQGYECGSLLVRRPRELREAFGVTADYLQDVALGEERPNLGEWGMQLTRSARSIKVWLSLKTFGLERFRAAVDRTLDLAGLAEELLASDPEFELLSPARLGVVCFRYRGRSGADPEGLNRRLMEAVNSGGYAFISSTRVRGQFSLRFCILSHRTREADVRGVLERIRTLGRGLDGDPR